MQCLSRTVFQAIESLPTLALKLPKKLDIVICRGVVHLSVQFWIEAVFDRGICQWSWGIDSGDCEMLIAFQWWMHGYDTVGLACGCVSSLEAMEFLTMNPMPVRRQLMVVSTRRG